MRFARLWAAALAAGLALVAAVPPAAAQTEIGQLWCNGSDGASRIQGHLLADLWESSAPDPRAYFPQLVQGQIGRIPGLVRLFGHMQDMNGNLVNFEVFLGGGNQGTGSVWFNGARHREIHITLVFGGQTFTVYPETGGIAQFACTI